MEQRRGDRTDVGGLPVFLVLTKCDRLARPGETTADWLEHIEQRKREVGRPLPRLPESAAAPRTSRRASAVSICTSGRRPCAGRRWPAPPPMPNDPYGVAELFRQCLRPGRDLPRPARAFGPPTRSADAGGGRRPRGAAGRDGLAGRWPTPCTGRRARWRFRSKASAARSRIRRPNGCAARPTGCGPTCRTGRRSATTLTSPPCRRTCNPTSRTACPNWNAYIPWLESLEQAPRPRDALTEEDLRSLRAEPERPAGAAASRLGRTPRPAACGAQTAAESRGAAGGGRGRAGVVSGRLQGRRRPVAVGGPNEERPELERLVRRRRGVAGPDGDAARRRPGQAAGGRPAADLRRRAGLSFGGGGASAVGGGAVPAGAAARPGGGAGTDRGPPGQAGPAGLPAGPDAGEGAANSSGSCGPLTRITRRRSSATAVCRPTPPPSWPSGRGPITSCCWSRRRRWCWRSCGTACPPTPGRRMRTRRSGGGRCANGSRTRRSWPAGAAWPSPSPGWIEPDAADPVEAMVDFLDRKSFLIELNGFTARRRGRSSRNRTSR